MRHLLRHLTPFLLLGIALFAFTLGVMLFAYLFLFGVLVGLLLYCITWVREKFFHPKPTFSIKKPSNGRIIDSEQWERH